MKIMIYYLDLPRPDGPTKVKQVCDAKYTELKKNYPTLNIMVVPAHTMMGDKVEVIDLAPTHAPQPAAGVWYPPSGAASGGNAGPASYPGTTIHPGFCT